MKIGDTLGKYLIIEKIGEGGMGFVFKVRNIENGEFYALKYCKELDEKSIRRFKREVRVVSETKHKNIIELLDLDLDNSPPYFIMPLASGSLNDIIPQIKGDFNRISDIFDSICKGVSALHTAEKYHRDIKPRNILIMNDGSIVVTDFGLAKILNKDSSTHTSSNDFLGTVGYHAPEQLQAKNADHRTDVFQLGKSLYELFTGDYPYLIDPKKIPAGLVYIIQKATEPNPDERYQSVSELLQAINSFKKSMNPAKNPKDALENKLLEIENLLKEGYYREELCIELLELLLHNSEDYELFIEYFDRIPNQILKILANQLEQRFRPILDLYTKNLNLFFNETHFDFSYAETVSSKMSTIFLNTSNLHFKSTAIRNTLRAAVRCHRFKAMDSFNYLLQQIKNDEEAGLIGQILLDEMDLYKGIADQTASNFLHPAIIEVKNEALKQLEEDERKRIEEQEKMMKGWFKK